MQYEPRLIEPKWQARWEEARVFAAQDHSDKPKFYALIEFPYPSGAGMHVGHIKAYSGMEVISRKRRMQGYNVLFPIGFDAYGLPTENYAIKTGIHPRVVTDQNIRKFTQQLKRVGFSFDWSRTGVPGYGAGQLLPALQGGALQRGFAGGKMRHLPQQHRAEGQGRVVSADHRVCGQAA